MSKEQVIVCVDDDRMVLESLKMQLIRSVRSLNVETAADGTEGLELIGALLEEGVEIPVVVSDQIMPGMRGADMLAEVHKITPETLGVLLTGQSTTEDVIKAINYSNLFRFIAKPWNKDDLLLTVQRAIETYNRRKKLDRRDDDAQRLLEKKEARLFDSLDEAANIEAKLKEAQLNPEDVFSDHFVFSEWKAALGGDFRYLTRTPGGNVAYMLGDSIGHGVSAYVVSMIVMREIRRYERHSGEWNAPELLRRLNAALVDVFDLEYSVDFSLLEWNPAGGDLVYYGPKRRLFIASPDEISAIEAPDFCLGKEMEPQIEPTFAPRQSIGWYVLATDGFFDQFSAKNNKRIGADRFQVALAENAHLDGEAFGAALRSFFMNWKQDAEQIDDVTALGFKLPPV